MDVFGLRPNSFQARICVVGFSANMVWLVSRFYILYIIIFTLLQYQLRSPMQSDEVVRCSPMLLLVSAMVVQQIYQHKIETVVQMGLFLLSYRQYIAITMVFCRQNDAGRHCTIKPPPNK